MLTLILILVITIIKGPEAEDVLLRHTAAQRDLQVAGRALAGHGVPGALIIMIIIIRRRRRQTNNIVNIIVVLTIIMFIISIMIIIITIVLLLLFIQLASTFTSITTIMFILRTWRAAGGSCHGPARGPAGCSSTAPALCHSYPCQGPGQLAERLYTTNGYSWEFAAFFRAGVWV